MGSGGSQVNGVDPVPNGTAASFVMGMFNSDGDVVPVAKMSNLTEASTEWGLRCFWRYKGRVAEMQVSGWEGEAFLFPRFVRWRRGEIGRIAEIDNILAKEKEVS